MDFLQLHFIRPLWLASLPLAVIMPLLWRRLSRPSGDWGKVCDAHLLRWLSVGNAAAVTSRFGPWLAGLGWLVAAIALSGPSWQKLPDSSFSSRDARVLVLDLSLSMQAEDLKPNRLAQAHFKLSDMLETTTEGQTGLVAYAGDAFVVSPLTNDTNTIRNMLPALRPDVMPVFGSRPDRALELAAQLLQRSGMPRGEILLISDGGTSAAASVAAKLAKQGIFTSVLAVGTVKGAPIPSGEGFVSDRNGNIVVARLERDALLSIARAGGGKYSELSTGGPAGSPWASAEGSEFARKDDALGERWKDTGPWLVLLLLPLVALSFRRGLLFVLPLSILPGLLISADAKAGFWDDLWATRDQQAQAALQQERPADAAALARNPAIAGEAFYRNGDFVNADQSWSQVNQGQEAAEPHYNRGNALAQMGKFDEAIAAYNAALELDPEMEDAAFNRDLVEQMKQQQEQQQQDQEGESDQEQSDDESQEGEQGEEQSSEEQQEGEQADEESDEQQESEENAKPSESEMEQNWSEEDAQAMEQWLRRIPDDPGGLLRRKFRNQHERRGAPSDESETW